MISTFPVVTPLLSSLHTFFSSSSPLYPASAWGYVLVPLLISNDAPSLSDGVHVLASVTDNNKICVTSPGLLP